MEQEGNGTPCRKLSGKRAQAGTGQGDAGDSGTGDATSLVLEYYELQRHYDQLSEDDRNGEDGQQIRADLTLLKGEFRQDKRRFLVEFDVAKELTPKRLRMTHKQIATALDIHRNSLSNWRREAWYKGSMEKVRRRWRRNLDTLAIFHPYGIGVELQDIVDDETASHTDRLKALQMSATLLQDMVPADMKEEEETAPDVLIGKLKKAILQKHREFQERKAQLQAEKEEALNREDEETG